MIKPTIGRVVWFHSEEWPEQQLAAIVCFVNSDYNVNLGVFNNRGETFGVQNVPLIQENTEKPVQGFYCEWMPYQLGQAAKTEEALKSK
jgi:hypothetical protein